MCLSFIILITCVFSLMDIKRNVFLSNHLSKLFCGLLLNIYLCINILLNKCSSNYKTFYIHVFARISALSHGVESKCATLFNHVIYWYISIIILITFGYLMDIKRNVYWTNNLSKIRCGLLFDIYLYNKIMSNRLTSK